MKTIESEIINRLRLPLMLLVVLLHSNVKNVLNYMGGVIDASNVYTLYGFLSYFFTGVLGRVAVPLFFLISGYLFFRWVNCFGWSVYKKKIFSRVRTLFMPFILWNALYILVFFVISKFSKDEALTIYRNVDVCAILVRLWIDPPCYPFWFIRDLMVLSILSIVIYPILKYGKALMPILVLVLYLGNLCFSVKGFDGQSYTFFLLGAYGGIQKWNLPKNCAHPTTKLVSELSLLYIALGIVETSFRYTDFSVYIHHLNILVGIIVFVLFTAYCVNHDILKIPQRIAGSAFFLFGFHGLFVKMVRNSIIPILKPASDTAFLCVFALDFVVTVAVGVLLYEIAIKFMPKTVALFCGGR